MKANPTRVENPDTLATKQIKSAEDFFAKRLILSRGQRKRLQKKEKFINQKLLEKKSEETA